jgi:hypothetical protein
MSETIEQAVEKFNQGQVALLGENGQPRFVPDEHQRQVAALQAELQSVVDAEVTTAESTIKDLQAKITAIQARSSLDALSQAELQRANDRAQFVREDLAGMPLDTLANRLKTMLVQGDKSDLFLCARYLPARLETEGKKPSSPANQAAIRELVALLRQAGEKLNPSGEAEIAKLRKGIEEAQFKMAHARRTFEDMTGARRVRLRL